MSLKLESTQLLASKLYSRGISQPAPVVSSVEITDSSYNVISASAVSTEGGYIIVNGYGFAKGCTVYVGKIAAVSTTYVSSTKLRVQLASSNTYLSIGTIGSNIVAVINPDNTSAFYLSGVFFSSTPIWLTSSIGSQPAGYSFSTTLSAISDSAVTYAVTGGSLPSGVTLSSSGELSGTATGLNVDTVYSFTVTATDAETQTTVSSFNITFVVGDSYFSNTTLLLNGEIGNGGVTSTWLSDATASNLQLVPASTTVKSSNFSPFNTTWSNWFDGTANTTSLTTPQNAAFNLGTGDFSVEAWVYATATQSVYPIVQLGYGAQVGGPYTGWSFNIVSLTSIQFYRYDGTETRYTFSVTIPQNTWVHVAVTRSSSSMRAFLNGVQIGAAQTATTSYNNVNSDPLIIGKAQGGAAMAFPGYISNVRVIKGSAIYTSSFTPSTIPLTAITNTVLLTCQSNSFVDNSTNKFTLTTTGAPQISGFWPFSVETDLTTGSGYFNGSSDYLSIANNSAFVLGSGNFTIECWVYLTAFSTTNGIYAKRSNNGYGDICLLLNNANLQITCSTSGSAWAFTDTTIATGVAINSWYHIAVVRNGNTIFGFVNGVPGTAVAISSALYDSGQASTIGSSNAGASQFFNGYISNFRFVKGVAVYSNAFNLPTAAFPDLGTSDSYFNNTVLLLHGDGTNLVNNNVFVDSSTNNFSITRNGNATQGTFTPFSQTGWSNYFGAYSSGNVLTYSPGSSVAFGTGDFTIEAFVYFESDPGSGANPYIIDTRTDASWSFSWNYNGGTNALQLAWTNASGTTNQATIPMPINQWNHCAYVRSGTTGTIYLNGVSILSFTDSSNYSTNVTTAYIGKRYTNATGIPGYLSNLRIVKGTAVYTAAFTPPTTSLAAITNTVLLTCQSNRYVDNSASPFTITSSPSLSVQAFSPFLPTAAYDTSVVGGSGYFDGTGDSLSLSSTSLNLGSNDFTIEMWVYATTTGRDFIIGSISDSAGLGSWMIMLNDAGPLRFFCRYNGGTVLDYIPIAGGGFTINKWTHLAVTRSGANLRFFQDGAQVGTTNTTLSTFSIDNASTNYYVGRSTEDTGYFTGYLSGTRVLVGTALYTQNFAPATTPLTNITNTQLLLNYTNAGIIDNTAKNVLETVGNAQLSTTQSKWGGSSMYFDGVSPYSYLKGNANLSQNIAFGTGDFTIECWVYLTSAAYDSVIMDSRPGSNSANYFLFYLWTSSGSTLPTIAWYAPTNYVVSTGTVSAEVWTHIAICRASGILRSFKNGIVQQTAADTTSYANPGAPYPYIGASYGIGIDSFKGYIDDLRITKGIARYTTAYFTVPSQPLSITQSAYTSGNTTGTAVTGTSTSLLTAQYRQGHNNNGMQDSSNGKLLITSTGTPTQGTFTPFNLGSNSIYFDGSATSVLSITSNSALAFDTGAYTVEAWVYQTKRAVGDALIFSSNKGAETNSFIGYIKANGSLSIEKAFVGAVLTSSANDVPLNTWCHIAFVRTSTAANGTKLYVNGIVVATGTDATNWSGYAAPGIGVMGANADYTMVGNISNLRVVKGTAVYTSAFTPSTIPLTPVTNTVLLTCQSPSFTDNSYLNSTITATGTTSVQNFNPFKALRITPTTYSGYFNGSSDYISLPANAALAMGTGNFTFECWAYFTTIKLCAILDIATTGNANRLSLVLYANGSLSLDTNINALITSTGRIIANQWYHLALVRSGTSTNQTSIYINGMVAVTGTVANDFSQNSGRIANAFDNQYLNGYLSNLRLVKGVAVYTNNFAIPTTPLTTTQGLVTGVPASFSYIATGTTSWTCPVGVTSVDYLVVGGGGGGGSNVGGGGGAGGLRTGTGLTVIPGDSYTITVGAGGPGAPSGGTATNGSLSLFYSISSAGGGYGGLGGPSSTAGGSGGSGGGGGGYTGGLGGAGNTPNQPSAGGYGAPAVPYQGNTGGTGDNTSGNSARGGGGGGASAVGGTYPNSGGGNGQLSTLSGSSVTYAGGGGGGGYSAGAGAGGSGGGGAGGASSVAGTAGTTNTGGGGGGGGASNAVGAAGGSGIVILRYTGSDLSAIAGNATSLLTLQSNTFTDNSSNALTFTVTGSPKVQTFSPFAPNVDAAPSAYSTSIVGGSMYFNGSSDHIRSTYYNWFSGDATIEGWFYMTSDARYQGLWGGGVDLNGINLQYNETGVGENKLHLFIGTNAGWGTGTTTNTTLYPYTWYHIAYTKTSGNLHYLYINGVVDSSINGISNSFTWSGTNFYVGTPMFTNRYFNGYISNLAVHNYRKYTSNFVPSALPLSATTRTTLLLSGTNTAIIDQTGKNDLQTVGDVRLSNSVYKYGNNSMYFDGTGDYLVIPPNPAFRFGSADFTIEAWIYPTYSTSSGYTMGWHNNGTSFSLVTGSTLILLNTWTHIVWSKTGTSMRFFINGVLDSDGVKTVSSIIYNNVTDPLKIGFGVDHTAGSGRDFCHCGETGGSSNKWFAYLASGGTGNFYGYIDDFRITTGYARYTTNFTAPGLLLGK